MGRARILAAVKHSDRLPAALALAVLAVSGAALAWVVAFAVVPLG